LLKEGKFDESIKNYEKAMSLNPQFYYSRNSIGYNHVFMGKYEDARKQFQSYYDKAPDDGARQQALFSMMSSYICEGKLDLAMEQEKKVLAMAEKNKDVLAIQGAWNIMGDLLLEMDKADDAAASYKKAVETVTASNLSKDLKDNAQLGYLTTAVQVAVKKNDAVTAKMKLDEYRKAAEAAGVPMQTSHQLAGYIAFLEKDYDKAIAELSQGNPRNPRVLFALSEAYAAKAEELEMKVANFNEINYNYMFVRNKAK